MLPACRTTIVGPSSCASADARASGRIRPWASTGTTSGSPSPRNRSGRSTDGCRSAPTRTRTGGPPTRPRRMSWPARVRTVSRAGREAGEVRHRRAGHEADRALARQPEQVEDPTPGDLLHRRRGGRERAQPGVLVPRRGQPVRTQGRRQRTADDHAEEATRRDRDQPRLAGLRQQVDHLGGGRRPVRQVAEPAYDLVGVDRRRHRPVVERGQPGLRMMVCPLQCRPSCLHPHILAARFCESTTSAPACTSHSRDEVRRPVAPALAARRSPWSPSWSLLLVAGLVGRGGDPSATSAAPPPATGTVDPVAQEDPTDPATPAVRARAVPRRDARRRSGSSPTCRSAASWSSATTGSSSPTTAPPRPARWACSARPTQRPCSAG